MFLREGRKLGTFACVLAVAGLAVAGCGADDGADVRGSGSASGSGAGSGSGSGSVSGSGSGSESGGGGDQCELVGNSDADPAAAVQVTLDEFAVTPVPAEVAAGTVQFTALNEGEETHELVIIRYDGDPADLPVDDDGAADEAQLPESDVIGEIEGFGSGNTCAGAFDLEAGSYVLLCNIVEEEESGETEAHYHEGMYTTFTVT